MNCNDCVCALVCKEAQDPKYRKQVQSGEIACCDFHPRPDDSLKNAISAVAKLDSTSGVPQSVYVVEECSELIKECSELIKMLMKKHRKKGNDAEIIDEACDVLTTILVMLHQYGWMSRQFGKTLLPSAVELWNGMKILENYKERRHAYQR